MNRSITPVYACMTCVWGKVVREPSVHDPRPAVVFCSRILCPMLRARDQPEQKGEKTNMPFDD